MRARSSRRSAPATTAGEPCSRSGRTRAGGASSSRGSTPGRPTPCSTSPPGTTLVARELVRQKDCFVVGVDQSPEMLEEGRRRLVLAAATRKVRLQEGDARNLPFEDGQFDALTFTYLLRYVEDPPAVLRELARVVKPGGTIAGLEFGVPTGIWRPLWELWTRVGLPTAGRADRRRLARGGRVPRPVDHAATTRSGRCRACCRPGATPGSRTCARNGSASAEGSSRGDDGRGKAGVLRAGARRLARLRDAAAPAVHALASLVRRGRRSARAALPPRPDAVGDRGVLPRDGRRRARARRAARQAAADADSRAPCSSRSRS